MDNNFSVSEMALWSKDIAETFGIAPVTLRKWSSELEKQGWTFMKDEQQRRAYTQRDYVALRYLRDLMKDKRKSLESACAEVVKRYGNIEPDAIAVSAIREHEQENALVVQAETMQHINDHLSNLTLAVQHLTERVELIVQEQVRHEISAARQQIASEIEAIAQQVSDQNKELREQIEIVVTETRAERHRKKSFWERIFGK
ncbi:hypothetical protein P4G83_28710 [Bacillus cereus]|nr:hypothetical protein [Bacillus cereus]